MPLLIGIFYILDTGLNAFASVFGSALSCLGACNNLTPVYTQEAFIYAGLLILAVIEAVGLFRRRYWAKIFGIIFGILLLLPQLLGSYTTGASVKIILLLLFSNPFSLLTLFSIAFLAVQTFGPNGRNQKGDSKIMAFVLSGVGGILVGMNIFNYHTTVKPYQQQLDTEEMNKIQGVLKAGVPYENARYGFELTFPDDRTIFFEQGDVLTYDSRFTFAVETAYGIHISEPHSFTVEVHNHSKDQNSDYVSQVMKRDGGRDKISSVTINGVPCVKIEYWFGRSFEYVVSRGDKFFLFENLGGMTPGEFDPIMQTLRFYSVPNNK